MYITCLDLEGVLVPEIWIAFAQARGIPELERTTRDEPDYDKLMRYRLDILAQHGLKLSDIQETIATLDPLPGAKEFLDALREKLAHHLLQHPGSGPGRHHHRAPDALSSVQAHHGKGSPVGGLYHHLRRRQLQRPGHDRSQQGRVPFQEHPRHPGRAPRSARPGGVRPVAGGH